MRQFLKLLMVLMVFSMSAALFAQKINFNADNWSGRKQIQLTGNSKYKSFFLDREVYALAKSTLGDIRIFDKKKNQVAYYFQANHFSAIKAQTAYPASQIYSNRKDGISVYDFQVFSSKRSLWVNQIGVTILEKNFSRQVEVFGRSHSGDWEFIKKDSIYHIGQYIKKHINFDRGLGYQYFRIKVLNDKKPVLIKGLSVRGTQTRYEKKQYEREVNLDFEVKNFSRHSIVTVKHSQAFKLLELKLKVDGNFKRRYEFFRGKTRASYRGSLYHFEMESQVIDKTNIRLNRPFFVRGNFSFKIYNNGDSPLKIRSITAVYGLDKVVFEDKKNAPYTLYFGNKDVFYPSYDIKHFQNYIEKAKHDLVQLGPLEVLKKDSISGEESQTDYKSIFNMVLIGLSVLLIGLLVMKLRTKK